MQNQTNLIKMRRILILCLLFTVALFNNILFAQSDIRETTKDIFKHIEAQKNELTFVLAPKIARSSGENSFFDYFEAQANYGKPDKTIIILPILDTEYELQCIKGNVNKKLFEKSKVIYSNELYKKINTGSYNQILVYKGDVLLNHIQLQNRKPLQHKFTKEIYIPKNIKLFDHIYSLLIDNKIYEFSQHTGFVYWWDISDPKSYGVIDLSKQIDTLSKLIYNQFSDKNNDLYKLRNKYFSKNGNSDGEIEFTIQAVDTFNKGILINCLFSKVNVIESDTFIRNISTLVFLDTNWQIYDYYCFNFPMADYFPMGDVKMINYSISEKKAEIAILPKYINDIDQSSTSSFIYNLNNHIIVFDTFSGFKTPVKYIQKFQSSDIQQLPNKIDENTWHQEYIPYAYRDSHDYLTIHPKHVSNDPPFIQYIFDKYKGFFINVYTYPIRDSIYLHLQDKNFNTVAFYALPGNVDNCLYDNKRYLHFKLSSIHHSYQAPNYLKLDLDKLTRKKLKQYRKTIKRRQ